MADAKTWIIADDQIDEARSFAASFENSPISEGFAWKALKAGEAQDFLLGTNGEGLAGVLVDVDFSSDPDAKGTGLGLAQDLRANQKNKKIASSDFPIIRFANPDPVREYIGNDPASDDLFDLMIAKDAARRRVDEAVRQAIAARTIYDDLIASPPNDLDAFSTLCGVDRDRYDVWSDPRLWQKVRLGLSDSSATHVAAGAFLRTFLLPRGLLIDEATLAIRLGVDVAASPDWAAVLAGLAPAKFTGSGAAGFDRWWARAIDSFWITLDPDEYLHERASDERVSRLQSKFGERLTAIQPPARYWRACVLSARNGEHRAVDPASAITLVQPSPKEPWLDPDQATIEAALMYRQDPRVDGDELARLTR